MYNEIDNFVIDSFSQIRDLPYMVNLGGQNYYATLSNIVRSGNGSCSPKHYLLGFMCERLHIPVTYKTYPFHWSDLDIDWPKYIGRMAEQMPVQRHLAISVKVNGKEYFLDATWDWRLERAGFFVNKISDRLTDTKNAVVPCAECVVHESGPIRYDWVASIVTKLKSTGIEKMFYPALNKWLEKIRNENT